ncbi:hypothetical protein PR048_029009 [Dryococelus australis]|uniref:Uncharacterized protein n=1 Tax=Dryococelus australis TaxID=614101 RepID=A0ABQ9GEX6_9NEOP|nr:hypothetical protein PR048_029009 [Dryococelus australis]
MSGNASLYQNTVIPAIRVSRQPGGNRAVKQHVLGIKVGGPTAWPPLGPRKNAGVRHSCEYQGREELEARFRAPFETIKNTPAIFNDVLRHMLQRCRACIECGGNNSEHLLYSLCRDIKNEMELRVQGQEARERYGRQLHARLVPNRSYSQGVQCFRRNASYLQNILFNGIRVFAQTTISQEMRGVGGGGDACHSITCRVTAESHVEASRRRKDCAPVELLARRGDEESNTFAKGMFCIREWLVSLVMIAWTLASDHERNVYERLGTIIFSLLENVRAHSTLEVPTMAPVIYTGRLTDCCRVNEEETDYFPPRDRSKLLLLALRLVCNNPSAAIVDSACYGCFTKTFCSSQAIKPMNTGKEQKRVLSGPIEIRPEYDANASYFVAVNQDVWMGVGTGKGNIPRETRFANSLSFMS